ncbi:MAG: cytochrome ubiquinol oxidase subunit I [Candidatus Fibromonas sp.]|jgi:cytochrome d ubiquinol oxidase subunit I|nr:cytochrome ubiquinol oxidase subunit I [Candidatus Fibromonas sp.]
MDILFLSRLQFAVTTVYHFLFVPLTIGLGLFIAIWETTSYRSGNSDDERLARFWGRLFLLSFAVGIATGIVQEFQFGMNWSEYSRFVGDVFGVPLAIETLFAFFVESTFVGLWIFGRSILPRGVHLTCIWLVFAASCISAVWILIANSFMQHPVGYAFSNGRAELTNFWELISNPYFLHQYPHVISASICTAAFFVLGISAWKMQRGEEDSHLFAKTFRFALFMGFVGLIAVLLTGHLQMISLEKLQPMKFAAAENIKKTQDPAPLSLLPGIEIPAMLSIMLYGEPHGEVKGMEDLQNTMVRRYGPGDYAPNVWVSFFSFRIMVACALAMLFLLVYGLAWNLILKRKIHKKILTLMLVGISFPFLANTAGWILAEAGRQPWIVYGLMPTDKALSVGISRGSVIFSLIAFSVIYAVLAVVTSILMRNEILRGTYKRITKKNTVVGVQA